MRPARPGAPLARPADRADARRPPLLLLVERRQGRLPRAEPRRRRRAASPQALLCMLHEDGGVSRGHGLPLSLLERQAEALGLPLVTRATTWDGYEDGLHRRAPRAARAAGIQAGVFGDIDLEPHREWVERVCGRRRPDVPPAALAGAAPAARSTSCSRAACGPPWWPSTPPVSTRASSAASFTPALVADARGRRRRRLRRGGRVPHRWSPRRRCSPLPVEVGWTGVVSRDDHWVLAYDRQSRDEGSTTVMTIHRSGRSVSIGLALLLALLALAVLAACGSSSDGTSASPSASAGPITRHRRHRRRR